MKQVAKKTAEISKRVGVEGKDMGFDDFKVIETTIFKLEERLLPQLRETQR